jgi:hypothetical protein
MSNVGNPTKSKLTKKQKIAIGVSLSLLFILLILLILWGAGVFSSESDPPVIPPVIPAPVPSNRSFMSNTVECFPDGSYKQYNGLGDLVAKDRGAQIILDHIFAQQQHNDFGNLRFGIFLHPGIHNLHIQLGYYTSVTGLGDTPEDTTVHGSITCPNDPLPCVGALNNFYRCCSNLTIDVNTTDGVNYFSISQATSLRSVIVKGDLGLSKFEPGCGEPPASQGLGGYSSGGFMSNVNISGKALMATQQQFMSMNSTFTETSGGEWSIVFEGCDGTMPPDLACPNTDPESGHKIYTVIPNTTSMITPIPRLSITEDGLYSVVKSKLFPANTKGILPHGGETVLDNVFIANPHSYDTKTINEMLAKGTHVVFSPGVYLIDEQLLITQPDTVVLGIGYATLISTNKNTAEAIMKVSDNAAGVRIAGLLFDAGLYMNENLLEVGATANGGGVATNPTILQDIWLRVGGPTLAATCDTMMTINQNHVVVQSTWAWRADHANGGHSGGVGPEHCVVNHGIVVNGDSVTIHGLFSEHCLEENVIWNGDNGTVHFMQQELAYDVGGLMPAWGFPGLSVNGDNFSGSALGVYTFFPNKWNAGTIEPYVEAAIVFSDSAKTTATATAFTVFLNKDNAGGKIEYVFKEGGEAGIGPFSDISVNDIPQWCSLNPQSIMPDCDDCVTHSRPT